MAVRARLFSDPACSASWGHEPVVRRLQVEFGDSVELTCVMGGLARQYEGDLRWLYDHWIEVGERYDMPVDPRLWTEGPIGSTYPACMAVKAAAEQGLELEYLRRLREGIMCLRRKLDTTEALVEEARGGGLDVARFRIDLGSHAIVEAFGADLEETRDVPDEARERGGVADATHGTSGERLVLPSARFDGPGGRHWAFAGEGWEAWREAARAAGAEPAGGERPSVEEALRRFGRMAPAEVEAVCDLPGPRALAELWRLAAEWRARPLRLMTGWLFEAA